MPLSLKVPALEDQPLIQAETQPQKISQFLQNLPASDPLEAAIALQEEMEILNRQKVAPDVRVKALEAYRPTLVNIAKNLANHYCHALLPLPEQARKHAAQAELLWLELGYGYKLAIMDQQTRLFSLSGSKSTAAMITRAIETIGQLAMVYYQTYFVPLDSIWSDLHQLYHFAVQNGLQDIEVAGGSGKNTVSVSLAYKQALLMPLTDPQHLAPDDMQQIAAYIARHAQHAQLQGLAKLKSPAGIFLVSLDSDKPPVPYQKNAKQTDAASDILLITIELARLAHRHLQMLQDGNAPINGDLPDNAAEPRYQDLLAYLIKQWGSPPKRIFNRSRDSDSLELGTGIQCAHYFATGKPAAAKSSKATSQHIFPISRWQALNISAGGMSLRQYPNTKGSVQIGELLSVKSHTAAQWSIGVLRWASNNEYQQLDIGVQLIAPEAKAAGARAASHNDFQPVLLLPAMAALKQEPSIVAAYGLYNPSRILEFETDGNIARIQITKLVERTGSFERFQFSQIA